MRTSSVEREQRDTDPEGACVLPAEFESLRVETPGWTPTDFARAQIPAGPAGDVWLHRWGALSGFVVAEESGAPIRDARVSFRVAGSRPGEMENLENFSWLDGVARAYDIARGGEVDSGADGAFELRVPLVAGLHVHASAPGRAPGAVRIDVSDGSAPTAVVRLRNRMSVRGVVRSADGRPIAQAQVWLRVRQERPAGTFPAPSERLVDAAVTASGRSGGPTVVVLAKRVFSAADGSFDVPVPATGVAAIHVFALEHRVGAFPLGNIDASRDGADLRLDPSARGNRLVLATGGVPLSSGQFIASDVTEEDGFQIYNDYVDVGSDGTVPSEWLVAGHRYWFIVKVSGAEKRRWSGMVRWNGQALIDVAQLSMSKDIE